MFSLSLSTISSFNGDTVLLRTTSLLALTGDNSLTPGDNLLNASFFHNQHNTTQRSTWLISFNGCLFGELLLGDFCNFLDVNETFFISGCPSANTANGFL